MFLATAGNVLQDKENMRSRGMGGTGGEHAGKENVTVRTSKKR